MFDPPFHTGDNVRLKTGKSPIQVLEVDYYECSSPKTTPRLRRDHRPRKGWYIRFCYLSSLKYKEHESRSWRAVDDFILYESYQPEEEIIMTTQLYQTKEPIPRFGTYLTKNSQGQIVLEMKGAGGQVEAFDSTKVDEVMPYTVELTRFQGGDNDGPNKIYEMKEGSVKVGDVLVQLSNGAVWEVTKLDMKTRGANQSKNGFLRLHGDRI